MLKLSQGLCAFPPVLIIFTPRLAEVVARTPSSLTVTTASAEESDDHAEEGMVYVMSPAKEHKISCMNTVAQVRTDTLRLRPRCAFSDRGIFLDARSKYMPLASTALSVCWEFSNASQPTDCECEAGFYNGSVGGVDKCQGCKHGTYKTHLKNATCDACMEHANTSGVAAKTPAECLCVNGFTLEVPNELDPYAQRCIPCYAGFFKGWLGDEICDMCPVDHYCVQQSVSPVACPDFSVSLAGAVDVYECTCIEGYYHQYTHGYYSDELQREIAPSLTCVPCPQKLVNLYEKMLYEHQTQTKFFRVCSDRVHDVFFLLSQVWT